MGWLIVLAVLILLAIFPLGVSAVYNTHGALVRLITGPMRVTVFPRKKKENKLKEPKMQTANQAKSQKKTDDQTNRGGSYTDFLPLVRFVIDLLSGFRRKLRVDRLEMKLILADGDPYDLAINYGRAWAALGNLMPHLERLFVIKKRDLEVECDFTSEDTLIFARLDLTITLGRLLGLGVSHGLRILKEYFNIMNKRKGGAKQ